jgi:predicted ATPase
MSSGERDRLPKSGQRQQLRSVLSRGIPFFLAIGTIRRGWALTEHGQIEEGITQIRQGMTAWREMGAEGSRSWWLALLAEAHKKRGQTEEGLAALTEALAMVDKSGERHYEAELCRLYGELTLQQFKVQGAKCKVATPQPLTPNTQHPTPSTQAEVEAEACFLKAIEVSRQQEAKLLELRATMSLARLWQQQRKKKEARQRLAEIYHWFTEGFDTKDLQAAKALLAELA